MYEKEHQLGQASYSNGVNVLIDLSPLAAGGAAYVFARRRGISTGYSILAGLGTATVTGLAIGLARLSRATQ